MIYESDADAAPDDEFTVGELRHLVTGNRGRLLDVRRTPIEVKHVVPERGEFEVEILAFEDTGARWLLPLHDVAKFQFANDASLADSGTVARLEDAATQFDRMAPIEIDPKTREDTLRRIADEREAARSYLADVAPIDLEGCITRREGDVRLIRGLDDYVAARGLAEMDSAFAAAFVSNPNSGEIVKGHAIVLAELGVCAYHGKAARDPALFDDNWSKARRADHLIARLAFSAELWASLGRETLTLFRGSSFEGPAEPRPAPSFVSATFSEEVAQEHFAGGPKTTSAVMWRDEIPVGRVLMTFLETQAFNDRYKEAEAVLIG